MMRSQVGIRAALALACMLAAAPAAAQIGVPASRPVQFQPHFGVGYVANVPNQFMGVSAHVLTDRMGGLGLYVDAKFDLDSPEDEEGFVDSLTAAEVEDRRNDRLFHEEGVFTSLNVALMKAVTPQLSLYAGAGYADGQQYNEYFDDEREMGRGGFYYVVDEEESGGEVNFLGGAFFQLGNTLAIQIGGESKPAGFTVGLSYLIPLRR